jgi:hypothetical protein
LAYIRLKRLINIIIRRLVQTTIYSPESREIEARKVVDLRMRVHKYWDLAQEPVEDLPQGLEPNMLLARVRKIDERIHKFWQAREIAFPQRGNRILPAGRRGSMNPGRQSVGRWRRRCSCL